MSYPARSSTAGAITTTNVRVRNIAVRVGAKPNQRGVTASCELVDTASLAGRGRLTVELVVRS